MSSTKGSKEKSSSTKFWKKFGLSKSKTMSGLSSASVPDQHSGPPDDYPADDKSVKSKRLSGFFPQKRQSTQSLRKQPPAQHYPAMPSLATETASRISSAASDPTSTKERPPTTHVNETRTVERTPSHKTLSGTGVMTSVQSNATPVFSSETPPEHGAAQQGNRGVSQDSPGLRPRRQSNASKSPGIPVPSTNRHSAQTQNSTSALPNKGIPQSLESTVKTQPSIERLPQLTCSTDAQKHTPSISTSTPSSASSTSEPKEQTSPFQKSPTPSLKTVPSQPDAVLENTITKKKSVARVTQPNPPVPLATEKISGGAEGDQAAIIQKLTEDLEKERHVVRVLQGQKEAATKDLDYFSQLMDELMEEKEALQQKYEEEKAKNQQREEDLNVLLDKLKSSNDNARERSKEANQLRADLEAIQQQARQDQEDLKAQLKEKNAEIKRLWSELRQAQEQTQALKATIEQVVHTRQSPSAGHVAEGHRASKPTMITTTWTPTASPHMQPADISRQADKGDGEPHSPSSYDRSSVSFDPASPVPGVSSGRHPTATTSYIPIQKNTAPLPSYTSRQTPDTPSSTYADYDAATIIKNALYDTPSSFTSSNASNTTYSMEKDDLDAQLLRLTREKERLQSDYSKIPFTGGGPMSRRRKEELEEMLDEVDSQLSRVKQKIRRS